MTAVGDLVTVAPGTRWAGEDIGGQVLEVVQVADYPASVGGPVFVCRWPGTTTTTGACLQADQLGGAA